MDTWVMKGYEKTTVFGLDSFQSSSKMQTDSKQLYQISSHKMIIKKQFKENFRKNFFERTTIGGLRLILGRHPLPLYFRIFWILGWLVAVGWAIALCTNSYLRYLTYEIKTMVHYETEDEVAFPAITFCSENMFRKSVVGGSFAGMLALASFSAKNTALIPKMAMENNRTCFKANKSALALQFDKENIELFVRLGMDKVMQLAGMSSDITVVKCWWNSVESDCKHMLFNHVTDMGYCSTFNPSKRYLQINSTSNSTQDDYFNRVITNGGSSSGLQLLMNTTQEEYCGASRKYFGNSGFIVKVHNPEVQPRVFSEKSLFLSAGFRYEIVIKPSVIRRYTDNLGRCVKSMDLILYDGVAGYFKEACMWDGYMYLIWERCRCYHVTFNGFQEKFAQVYKIPLSNLTACAGPGLSCVKAVDETVQNSPSELLFSTCKQPCFEIKYNYQTTKHIFPSRSHMTNFSQQYSMSPENIKKDLLLANFRFESLSVEIIEENQKYTVLDLFRYFGGILSLFLGVSVICLGEISYFFAHYIHISVGFGSEKVTVKKKSRPVPAKPVKVKPYLTEVTNKDNFNWVTTRF